MALSRFVRWDFVLMLTLLGAVLALEMIGVFNGRFVTITAIIRAVIPRWLRWMILGWLTYHFGVAG